MRTTRRPSGSPFRLFAVVNLSGEPAASRTRGDITARGDNGLGRGDRGLRLITADACPNHPRTCQCPTRQLSGMPALARSAINDSVDNPLPRRVAHLSTLALGVRLRGIIIVMWRAGLRISEALALSETDLDPVRGSVLVRHGKGDKRREVGMDRWAWTHYSEVGIRSRPAHGVPNSRRNPKSTPAGARRWCLPPQRQGRSSRSRNPRSV